MRNAENRQNEQRGGQRQIAGQAVFLIGLRPVAEEGDEVREAEQHRLDREQIGKEGEEGRHFPPRQRRERRQRRDDADQKRHPVFLVSADDEGEDGESGEAQHAHGAEDLSGRETGRMRTSRPTGAIEGRLAPPDGEILAMFGRPPWGGVRALTG